MAPITAMLTGGLATLGGFLKDKAVDTVTSHIKDAFRSTVTEAFGSAGTALLDANIFKRNTVPDQALKIRISSAFEQKMMSVREPMLNLTEFKAEAIRADDPLKAIDKIHANIINSLNTVNKNTSQTFEYVKSSVKQQNVRIEDIKKSTAVVQKSYNDLNERISKMNTRVSDLERQRKADAPGIEQKARPVEGKDGGGGMLGALGSIMSGINSFVGGAAITSLLGRLGGILAPLAPVLGVGALAVGAGVGISYLSRKYMLAPDDVDTKTYFNERYGPGKISDVLTWNQQQKEKESLAGIWGDEEKQRVEKLQKDRAERAGKPEEKTGGGGGGSGATGSWDNKRTGDNLQKYELKKQSISMQSATDITISATQSIEQKARRIILKATDCISLEATKIVFSVCPTIRTPDGLEKLISQCLVEREDDEIPVNAKPTSGTLPKRTRMPGGRGGGGSMGVGGGGGGGAGGAGMGGGGLGGGTGGGGMGVGAGTGTAQTLSAQLGGGGFAGGGGGGFTGQGGATGSWSGSGIPDKSPTRDPNVPAAGTSYGRGGIFGGGPPQSGRGPGGSSRGGGGDGPSRPAPASSRGPPSRRRDQTTTTTKPAGPPLIEETYPGLGKGGTGKEPLIPPAQSKVEGDTEPLHKGDPNLKSITLEDIQKAVRNPGDEDAVGNQALIEDRKRYADEIKNNPKLRDMIAAMGETEVSGQPAAHTGHVEALMNRASKHNITLQQALNDPKYARFYAPFRDQSYQRRLANLTDADRLKWNPHIDRALGGSDTTDLATGTASGPEEKFGSAGYFGQGPGKGRLRNLDGEWFGEEEGTGKWRRQMRERMNAKPKDPNRKPGELLKTPKDDAELPRLGDRYQSNRDREEREKGNKTGSGTADDTGSRVREVQSTEAKVRKLPIQATLKEQLEYAAAEAGVEVEVFSGGQHAPFQLPSGKWTSHRHDKDSEGKGGAADIRLYVRNPDGTRRLLTSNNPADLVIIKKFTRESVRAGATGVGHGSEYMGPEALHIGGGDEASWGGADWIERERLEGKRTKLTPKQFAEERERQKKAAAEERAKKSANTAPPATANTAPAPTTANTATATAPAPRPPAPTGDGSQGAAAAKENEAAGRPFWKLGPDKTSQAPSPVLSDASPDPVRPGAQYASLTTPSTTATVPSPSVPKRPDPPFLPPGWTPHSGPQWESPLKGVGRSDIPPEGLAPLTKGGPRIMPFTPTDADAANQLGIGDIGKTVQQLGPEEGEGKGKRLDRVPDAASQLGIGDIGKSPAVGKPRSQEELNRMLTKMASQRKDKLAWKSSVVDLMKLTGMNSSAKARKALAKQLGYTGKPNSRQRNIWLQKKIRSNLLDPPVPLPIPRPTNAPQADPLDTRSDIQKAQDNASAWTPDISKQAGIDDIQVPRTQAPFTGTPFDPTQVQGAPGTQSGQPPEHLSIPDFPEPPSATFDERFLGPSGRPRDTAISGSPFNAAGVQGAPGSQAGQSGVPAMQPLTSPIPHAATGTGGITEIPEDKPPVIPEITEGPIPTRARKRDLDEQPLPGQEPVEQPATSIAPPNTGEILSDAPDQDWIPGQQYAKLARASTGPSATSKTGATEPEIGNPKHFTFYYPGAKPGGTGKKVMEGPMETLKPGLTGVAKPSTLDDYRLGKSTFVTVASPRDKLGQRINLGDIEYRSPIDGKIYKLSNVPGYTHDTGSDFTTDKPYKRDIAVGDFSGINPDTGEPFTDQTAHQFSIKHHKQYAPGTFDKISSQQPIPPVDTPDKTPGNTVEKPVPAATPVSAPSTAIPTVPQIDQTKAAPAVVEATRAKNIEVDREKQRADKEKKNADNAKDKEAKTKKDKKDSDVKDKKDKTEKPEEKVVKPTHDPENERPGANDDGGGGKRNGGDMTGTTDQSPMEE